MMQKTPHLRIVSVAMLAFLVAATAKSQIRQVPMTSAPCTVAAGLDGTVVEADSFLLDKAAYDMHVDEQGTEACLRFRSLTKKGKWGKQTWLRAVDLTTMTPRWEWPVEGTDYDIDMTRQGVMLTYADKVAMMQLSDGYTCWQKSLLPVYWNDSLDIVLGYTNITSNKVHAYRMSTGEELWTAKIAHETRWGWNDVMPVGDDHLLVVADGICLISLTSGDLKKADAKTGVVDVKRAILQGLAAVGGAVVGTVISGGSYVPYVYGVSPNVISGLTSNILFHDSLLYVSDRTRLRCFDLELNEQWSYEWPAKTASAANLFVRDQQLCMVNYGFGIRSGSGLTKSGKPFIASFDLPTGTLHNFNQLSTKNNMILGAVTTEDHALLLFNDGMACQHFEDSLVNINTWDVGQYGKLYEFLPDTLYAYHDNDRAMRPLAFDGFSCPVYAYNDKTHQASIFVIDEKLSIIDQFPYENTYRPLARHNGYLFVADQHGDAWVIHEFGLPVAHATRNDIKSVGMFNDYIYMLAQNALLRVETDRLLR
ncbi:MAG: hypothetical protein IJ196_01405 [Prevotella sp.]|nr:hypothetical protein [Prevotella sp.]